MELYEEIILEVIRKHPETIKVNTNEIRKLFCDECYKKLKEIRSVVNDNSLDDEKCLENVIEVLFSE